MRWQQQPRIGVWVDQLLQPSGSLFGWRSLARSLPFTQHLNYRDGRDTSGHSRRKFTPSETRTRISSVVSGALYPLSYGRLWASVTLVFWPVVTDASLFLLSQHWRYSIKKPAPKMAHEARHREQVAAIPKPFAFSSSGRVLLGRSRSHHNDAIGSLAIATNATVFSYVAIRGHRMQPTSPLMVGPKPLLPHLYRDGAGKSIRKLPCTAGSGPAAWWVFLLISLVVYQQSSVTIHQGDCREVLKELPDESVNCCVTSPPYWQVRDYGVDQQIGLEPGPHEYIAELVRVFAEVRRVLRDDGTAWVNLGDCSAARGHAGGGIAKDYQFTAPAGFRAAPAGWKAKDLMGLPWRVAFALQDDGWFLRQDIVWYKPNCKPESVKDRPSRSHEYLFLLSKSPRYYYDIDAIREPHKPESIERAKRAPPSKAEREGLVTRPDGQVPNTMLKQNHPLGRNRRSVWQVVPTPYPGAHFATFPPNLIEPCILAGCPEGGTVLDPFGGSGTTAEVAKYNGRKSIMIELNPDYIDLMRKRLQQETLFGAMDESSTT